MSRTIAVGVVLIENDSVLLVKHTRSAKLPTGAYGFPAGRYDLKIDSSFEEGAIRELREETGLESTVSDLIPLSIQRKTLNMKNGTEDFEFHPYLCLKYSGELKPSKQNIPEFIPIEDIDKITVIAEDIKHLTLEGHAILKKSIKYL
jgi:8-oxo-dGTP pyrophosphatase MutT (NUDIX family)